VGNLTAPHSAVEEAASPAGRGGRSATATRPRPRWSRRSLRDRHETW